MARKWNNYGIPYQGSKNRILRWLSQNLPRNTHGTFVDLFCGGCSVTHYMMTQGSFAHYVINDINPMMPRTFLDAINGKYHDERRWISRQQFRDLRLTDAYAACCFSFGNNYCNYMYSESLEPYKRACHYAVVFNLWEPFIELCPEVCETVHEALDSITPIQYRCLHGTDITLPMSVITLRRRLLGRTVVSELKRIADPNIVVGNPLYNSCHRRPASQYSDSSLRSLQSLERLECLQSLESLERLERLQRLSVAPSLQVYSGDYQDVPIPDDATVYCDIPYKGTGKYKHTATTAAFSHDRFYRWALTRDYPVFVSEYHMPEGFTPIATLCTVSSMAAVCTTKSTEHLYVQDRFAARYQRDLFGGW